jgi:hypothetical protein
MRRKPEIFRALVQRQDHARDQAQHVLDTALGFDAGRKCGLDLTPRSEEHLPEDLFHAGELVVERPPGDASGRGQLIHADSAEAAFQEQALRGIDNGLSRSSAAAL